MATGEIRVKVGATIVKENCAMDIESAVSKVRQSFGARTPDEVDTILRAVHMRRKGERELSDMNDRFKDFWIALETLINMDGRIDHIAERIENALIQLYESNNPGKKYKVKSGYEIILIKKERVGQIHYAIENTKQLSQLKAILDDIIRSEVGLDHRGYAKQYLEEKI